MNDTLFTIYGDASDGTRIDKTLRKSQVSMERLGMIFRLIPALIADFGSSEFPTPIGKFACRDTAEAGTFYEVEGETKENVPTLPYRYYHRSQINLDGFGSFR